MRRPSLIEVPRAMRHNRLSRVIPATGPEVSLDVLLVVAIDASGSLSEERLMLQREGHARALRSPAFLEAVSTGLHGRVGITAVEWSHRQDQILPWAVIEDAGSAAQFAEALMRAPRPMPGYTAIGAAIDFSVDLLARAPHAAARRIIDISGNGPNNDGRSAAEARDDAVAAGVTVNGLPILDAHRNLDAYFAQSVIGGPRAFMVVARDAASFSQAILRKLVAEIA
ncbi:DUF1194 domain-containing protein [Falsiroseomonas sp.]|uniref:DUF1194 domain-containing protein n=1 Tax=Falsiroseomonas sp. TaxID=2870721 RepID=UPI00356852EE